MHAVIKARWIVVLGAACSSRSAAVHEPARPLASATPAGRCLAWGRNGPATTPVAPPHGHFRLVGEVTTDERQPFGMDVALLRDGHVIGRDVTHPAEPVAVAALETETVGRYSFVLVPPGDYELVLKYDGAVVARELVTITTESYTVVKSHVKLSALPRIPVCA